MNGTLARPAMRITRCGVSAALWVAILALPVASTASAAAADASGATGVGAPRATASREAPPAVLGQPATPVAAGRMADGADPTRPPVAWLRPAVPASAAASGPARASEAPPPAPRLLSVRLDVSHPAASTALIGDRLVRVGDRVGTGLVTAIDAQGVTLRGPGGPIRLKLAPDVVKTAVDQAAPAERARLFGRKD